MLGSNEKAKNSRASKPKTRTGCKTCKIRRVKCDEAKPSCERCRKFGMACDGYDEVKTYQRKMHIFRRQIAPKIPAPSSAMTILSQTLPSVLAQPTVMSNLLNGPQDMQYFQYFQEESARQLSGGFDDPLWNRVALQMVHEAPCLQQITLSISGLTRAFRAKCSMEEEDSISAHHRYALKQYGKSLKQLREFIATNTELKPRVLLMAGILIYQFESLQGNTAAAVSQLRSLENLKNQHFLVQSYTASVEDEDVLFTAFVRIDGQFISRPGLEDDPYATNFLSKSLIYSSIDIPVAFPDIMTGRRILEYMHWRGRPKKSPPDIEEGRRLTNALAQWWPAFKPLFDDACTPAGHANFVSAYVMRVQWLFTWIMFRLHVAPNCKAVEPDVEDPSSVKPVDEPREIVRLCKILAADPRFVKGYVCNVGIIPYVWTVVLTTPDLELAREALGLLTLLAPRREGFWDSVEAAGMASRVLADRERRIEVPNPCVQ